MKRQKRRGPERDGELSDAACTEEQRTDSEQQPIAARQIRRPTTRATQNDQLLLEQEILRDDRPHATGTRQSRDRDDQVQQRDQDTCHVRVSVGQPSAAAQRCRIVYSAPKLAIRDPQVGAAGGAGIEVLNKGKDVRVPAETLLKFRLDKPVSLQAER
jgi:hypothetical protein